MGIMTITSNPMWVHSLEDYCSMFNLDEQTLKLSILDYPAGISSFNSEMFAKGHANVVSADRHYDLSPMDMVKHVGFVIQDLSENIEQWSSQFHQAAVDEIDDFLNRSNQYAQLFLRDYSVGQQESRYQVAKLPRLPFNDLQFDLALCSDLMFRSPKFTPLEVATELARIAKEVRIFPLMDRHGEISAELGPVMLALQQQDFGIEVKEVSFKLHKKSNAMLRVWAKACAVT